MDQMEDKITAILNNPQLMGQIMSMAQSLNQTPGQNPPQQKQDTPLPEFDPAILQKLTGLASQGSVDGNQKALLTALHPYLSRRKVEKLEKAMRAAKVARMASGFLGQGGLSLLTGR